jgi:hypothetical protein
LRASDSKGAEADFRPISDRGVFDSPEVVRAVLRSAKTRSGGVFDADTFCAFLQRLDPKTVGAAVFELLLLAAPSPERVLPFVVDVPIASLDQEVIRQASFWLRERIAEELCDCILAEAGDIVGHARWTTGIG